MAAPFEAFPAAGEKPAGPQSGGRGLAGWPIQLKLISPGASFLDVPELVLAADCTAFAYPAFQAAFGSHGPLVIGCPKLDDVELYIDKLTAVLRQRPGLLKITVVMMTVPCCQGLQWLAGQACRAAGRPETVIAPYQISPEGVLSEPLEGGR
jgi:hypothetical protein